VICEKEMVYAMVTRKKTVHTFEVLNLFFGFTTVKSKPRLSMKHKNVAQAFDDSKTCVTYLQQTLIRVHFYFARNQNPYF